MLRFCEALWEMWMGEKVTNRIRRNILLVLNVWFSLFVIFLFCCRFNEWLSPIDNLKSMIFAEAPIKIKGEKNLLLQITLNVIGISNKALTKKYFWFTEINFHTNFILVKWLNGENWKFISFFFAFSPSLPTEEITNLRSLIYSEVKWSRNKANQITHRISNWLFSRGVFRKRKFFPSLNKNENEFTCDGCVGRTSRLYSIHDLVRSKSRSFARTPNVCFKFKHFVIACHVNRIILANLFLYEKFKEFPNPGIDEILEM